MLWHCKASEKIGKGDQTRGEWAEKLRQDGHDASDILEEEPELFEDLVPYWLAFHLLSASRNSGFGVSAIPLPAYESYFRITGIDSLEERFEYIHFVGVLDSAFLKWHGDKNEAERQKKDAKAKSKPSPARRTTPARPPRR